MIASATRGVGDGVGVSTGSGVTVRTGDVAIAVGMVGLTVGEGEGAQANSVSPSRMRIGPILPTCCFGLIKASFAGKSQGCCRLLAAGRAGVPSAEHIIAEG